MLAGGSNAMLFNKSTLLFIYFSISLNPPRVQCHMDSVSSVLSRKVASEFDTSHATVSTRATYLSPHNSAFLRFSTRSYVVFALYT